MAGDMRRNPIPHKHLRQLPHWYDLLFVKMGDMGGFYFIEGFFYDMPESLG